MHKNRFIHRDLKSGNILVGKDGYIKVADFGEVSDLSNKDLTQNKKGTYEYMAPEVVDASPEDDEGFAFEADWWSFGVLLYELATGKRPF